MTKEIVRIFLSKERRKDNLVRVGDTRIDYLEWVSPFDIRRESRNPYETAEADACPVALRDGDERREDSAEGYYVVADLDEEKRLDDSPWEPRPRWLH